MGSVSQLMHAGRYYINAITHAYSGYKSQRRDRNQGEEKRRTKERKKKTEREGNVRGENRDELTRTKEN
jgi:hypothetical protein